jgi:hypothetical protein
VTFYLFVNTYQCMTGQRLELLVAFGNPDSPLTLSNVWFAVVDRFIDGSSVL